VRNLKSMRFQPWYIFLQASTCAATRVLYHQSSAAASHARSQAATSNASHSDRISQGSHDTRVSSGVHEDTTVADATYETLAQASTSLASVNASLTNLQTADTNILSALAGKQDSLSSATVQVTFIVCITLVSFAAGCFGRRLLVQKDDLFSDDEEDDEKIEDDWRHIGHIYSRASTSTDAPPPRAGLHIRDHDCVELARKLTGPLQKVPSSTMSGWFRAARGKDLQHRYSGILWDVEAGKQTASALAWWKNEEAYTAQLLPLNELLLKDIKTLWRDDKVKNHDKAVLTVDHRTGQLPLLFDSAESADAFRDALEGLRLRTKVLREGESASSVARPMPANFPAAPGDDESSEDEPIATAAGPTTKSFSAPTSQTSQASRGSAMPKKFSTFHA